MATDATGFNAAGVEQKLRQSFGARQLNRFVSLVAGAFGARRGRFSVHVLFTGTTDRISVSGVAADAAGRGWRFRRGLCQIPAQPSAVTVVSVQWWAGGYFTREYQFTPILSGAALREV